MFRLTDRLNMTIANDRDVTPQTKPNTSCKNWDVFHHVFQIFKVGVLTHISVWMVGEREGGGA